MKNKHMQMNKVLVMMLCAAMTVEPAAAYGADFTDGIEIKTEIPEASEDLTEPETQKTVPEEEPVCALDFRVYVTKSQMEKLKKFLNDSGIRFEPVPRQ